MQIVTSLIAGLIVIVGAWFGITHTTQTPSGNSSSVKTVTENNVSQSSHSDSGQVSGVVSAKTETATPLPAGSAWLTTVPLGDGKYVTNAPKKGYIYICHVQSGGGGAQVDGPWIHGNTWTPSEKIHVEGNVNWPDATYKMSVVGSTRTISSNDLPTDHTTGIFPIGANDPAAKYDRNPSSVTAKSYSFSLPAYPSASATPGCIYGEVGIMNNGVLLFDGFDAEYRDAVAHELQDTHDGHPNNEGYHKHGFINDIKNVAVSKVVGFAFDGYPITGPLLPSGKYLTTNDLDECHGMTSEIMLDGKMQNSFHYVLTQDFPYSVSCFHGTSKITPQVLMGQSGGTNTGTQTQGQAPASGQGAPAGGPPAGAISACSGKYDGSSCSFSDDHGSHSGTCHTPPNASLACVPQ